MDNYTIDVLRSVNITSLARSIKLTKAQTESALRDGDDTLTKEQIINILKEGVPIEPFLIGLDEWENISREKSDENSKNEEFLGLLLDDAKKQKSHPFPLNKEAYIIFLKYRKDVYGKEVTKAGASRQKSTLRAYPLDIQQEMIAESIEKRWESIFKPKQYKLDAFQRNIDKRKKEERKTAKKQVISSGAEPDQSDSMSVKEMLDTFG